MHILLAIILALSIAWLVDGYRLRRRIGRIETTQREELTRLNGIQETVVNLFHEVGDVVAGRYDETKWAALSDLTHGPRSAGGRHR